MDGLQSDQIKHSYKSVLGEGF